MQDFNFVIRSVYGRIGVPLDRLLSDGGSWGEFIRTVRSECPSHSNVDDDEIKHRLLSLRKKGADNGGLPRLKRAYHGRFGRNAGAADAQTGA